MVNVLLEYLTVLLLKDHGSHTYKRVGGGLSGVDSGLKPSIDIVDI